MTLESNLIFFLPLPLQPPCRHKILMVYTGDRGVFTFNREVQEGFP